MALEPAFVAWKERANDGDLIECAEKMFKAKLKRVGREKIGPCPDCGGTDTFSINEGKGVWNCRTGQIGGADRISLAMHIGRLSFLQACEELTGEPPPRGEAKPLTPEQIAEREKRREEAIADKERRDAEHAAYMDKRLRSAQGLWDASQSIRDTLAEIYLHRRGIPTPPMGWPPSLRFHPSVEHELEQGNPHLPCLVCRVDDAWGDLIAVWRIYIGQDGDKARVENAKVGMGPAMGGSIRLNGIGPKVATTEGVETGFGVLWLRGFDIPCDALMSTSGMANWEPPDHVKAGIHYPDGDKSKITERGKILPRPGITAAKKMKERLVQAGREWRIAPEPAPKRDYLDIWTAQRMREQSLEQA